MSFHPNYLQQQYISIMEDSFKKGIENKDGGHLSTIMSCFNRMQPIGNLPDLFYDLWFHKMLTDNTQTFLNFLNPEYDKIWNIDAKQKSLYVERYAKILNDNHQADQMKILLSTALEFEMILDPNFIMKLQTNDIFTEASKSVFVKIAEKNSKLFFEKSTKVEKYK